MDTRTTTPVNGNRTLTERRMSTQEQIAFYLSQAQLAAHSGTTRRTEAFYLRQVAYFQAELAAG